MDVTSKVALVCEHILQAERSIKLVVHHSDGMWQFACGDYDHATDAAGVGGVCIAHLIDRQPDVQSCLDLEPGFLAELASGEWTRSAHDD